MEASFQGAKRKMSCIQRKEEYTMKAMNMKKRKTMMNMYVPPEIVNEIFLNLPCKPLCRFRSISKQYQSHIDDLQFLEEHRKRNMKASHLLIWDSTNPSNLHLFNMSMDRYSHIKTITTYKYGFTLPSSYGMVCLHGWDNKKIALFNPSSEEISPLPDLVEPFAYETINKPCAPTPTEWCNDYLGFGFDPKSRRYKIVQLIVRGVKLLRFHILTVTRNYDSSWRTVDVSSKSLVCYFRYLPICVDGVLYWEIWITAEKVYIKVLVFDLGTEETKIIESPAKWRCDLYGNGGHLALLEGALCCYDMTPPTDMLLMMNIWMLEYDVNNNVKWTLKYKLEIYSLNSGLSPLIPLYIYDGKRILFQDRISEGFYCYHIEDKRLKNYPLVGNVEGVVDSSGLIVHSETIGPFIRLITMNNY